MLSHPSGAREVCVVNALAPLGLAHGIYAEDHANGLAPISAITRGIQQSEVESHVLAIVCREVLTGRRLVQEARNGVIHRTTIFALSKVVNTLNSNSPDKNRHFAFVA